MLSNKTNAPIGVNHLTEKSSDNSNRTQSSCSGHKRARSPVASSSRSRPRGANHGARGSDFNPDVNEYIREHPHQEIRDGKVLIDVDALELELEAELRNAAEVPSASSRSPPSASNAFRSSVVAPPWVLEHSVQWNNSTLKAGKAIELQGGHFMFIIDVVKNLETDVIKVRGWQLKRCSELRGLLRKALNELAFIYEVELTDPRPVQEQSMIETDLHSIVKIRKLIRTNYPYPRYKLPDCVKVSADHADNMRYARENDGLVVRWKYTVKYESRAQRLKESKYGLNIRQKRLEGLTKDECSPGCYIDPVTSRVLWRGETVLGGSGVKQNHNRPAAGQSGRERHPPQDAALEEELFCPSCNDGFREFDLLVEHYQSLHAPGRRRFEGPSRPRNNVSSERSMDDLAGDMVKDLNLDASLLNRIYTFGDTCKSSLTIIGLQPDLRQSVELEVLLEVPFLLVY